MLSAMPCGAMRRVTQAVLQLGQSSAGRSCNTAFFGNAQPLRIAKLGPARQVHCTPIQMGRRSAKIANRKGKADAQKAKLYGKIGKQIAQAVRAGGSDVLSNTRLREVLAQAKLASLPNDIIERNMKKAADKNSADFSEVTYEAYGPGGTGFVMECLTDNVNRSASDVRTAVTKAGGKMADPGSVLFNFQRQGLIMVDAAAGEDAVFEAAMEAGAADFAPSLDEDGKVAAFKVLTAVEDYGSVSASLREQGIAINAEASGLAYVPLVTAEVDDEAYEANEALMERLMGVDDVDSVWTTCDGLES